MSEHTKGPWYAWDNGQGLEGVGKRYADEADLFHVVRASHRPLSEDTANMRLAASAPDLLDDLEDAASTLRHYEALHRAKNTEESTAKAEINATLAVRFEATIAKAKGAAE